VERVLSLLVAADALAREQQEQKRVLERAGNDWHRSLQDSLKTSTGICHELNGALQRYRWLPMVHSGVGRFTVTERATTTSTGQWAPWETWAVGTLLDVAKKPGELSRFRQCSECQQWFYAIRAHQQFCAESHRRRHTAQDPAFKEKRAIYMRETYRPLQKELQERTLEQLKGVRHTKGRG